MRLAAKWVSLVFCLTPALGQAHDAHIDEHIRDYILRNPDILLEAMDILSTREKQAALQQSLAPYEEIFTAPAQIGEGAPDAEIRVIEFFDYQCGSCKTIHPALSSIVMRNPQLRIEMRHLPILSPASDRAARFALAVQTLFGSEAHQQVHDQLWRIKGPISFAHIEKITSDMTWDIQEIKSVMESDAITARIDFNKDMALDLDVLGTPAFISRNSISIGRTDLPQMVQDWLGQ